MINVIRQEAPVFALSATDMEDGCAYESEHGIIYIGNTITVRSERIKGFSICGALIVWDLDTTAFRPIDLEIRVF